MAPTVERPTPPYLQIAEDIRRQIDSGELQDGDHVPSVRQLASSWGVTRPTAAKAISFLRSEGLVETKVGSGTTVCARAYPAEARLQSVRSTGRIYPPNERAVIAAAELVPAPPEIADALGVEEGTSVIRRHRVTYRDDSPVSASTTWMPGRFAHGAPKLLSRERILHGTIGYVSEVLDVVIDDDQSTEQTAAAGASEQHARDLGVPVGSPVALGRNWWRDTDGEVIEYGESVSVPGRWSTHRRKRS